MATHQKRPNLKTKPFKANLSNWQQTLTDKQQHAGKKPLPEPTSITQVCLILFMHGCRRIVLIQPEIKIGLYLAALVLISLVTDFLPFPRSYLSNKDNFLNQYFVKLAWGWTLLILGSFCALTSWIYCCGNRKQIKIHLSRVLFIGTVMWYFWTSIFVTIESLTGACLKLSDKALTRSACIKSGFRWRGFDISGHSFLLIYCNLLIMEECKCIRGWERIGELIRNQEFDEESPLKDLKEDEKNILKTWYPKLTPYIKCLFIALTCLLTIFDVMLVATILYFHSMAQKVAGGLIAVVIWYVTYRMWYQIEMSPGLPGNGPFKYANIRTVPVHRHNFVRNSSVTRS